MEGGGGPRPGGGPLGAGGMMSAKLMLGLVLVGLPELEGEGVCGVWADASMSDIPSRSSAGVAVRRRAYNRNIVERMKDIPKYV